MSNKKIFLNKLVSYQSSVISKIVKNVTIKEVLYEIKSKNHEIQIDKLREFINNEEFDKYDIHKRNLPAVTFCATFQDKRNRENLKDYNQIIVLDIDKLDKEEIDNVKGILENDKYVFTSFESPSKEGIKGLVSIAYNNEITDANIDELHKYAFNQVKEYFSNKYGIQIDKTGSDLTRLCFLSYDPNLKIKERLENFNIKEIIYENSENNVGKKENIIIRSFKKPNLLYDPLNKNKPIDRKNMQSIIRFLSKRKLSITYSYEEWYRVAFALSNTFTFDIGKKYFLSLCKLDVEKFNESKCINLLINCYENSRNEISIKSIIHFAKEKGYSK